MPDMEGGEGFGEMDTQKMKAEGASKAGYEGDGA